MTDEMKPELTKNQAETSKVKGTFRAKAPSNETPALTKSRSMGIWVVDASNQLFIRGSLTETKFSKK